jgi:hypothetical protein
MSELPPPLPESRNRDAEHLKLLTVFHFVIAGLSVLGLGFLFLHYFLMHTIFGNPKFFQDQNNGGPQPQEIFAIFQWFYVVFGVVTMAIGIGNLLSGFCLRARKSRTFSLVIAGLNCVIMPFGTILGVFTLIVLTRDSVRGLYETKIV